jgi:hypothetical protein
MDLQTYLADCDPRYSPDLRLLGATWSGPGYHTRVPNGSWAHPTRESLDYALALLQSGAPKQVERAAEIVAAVLAHQDTDPTSRTYGIWPWLAEEPLAEMSPPDWNWADFCGARLAQMLADHRALLPAELAGAMLASLGHAAWSIFRRNVGPGYTNIAIMGAGVALAAGELLGEPRLAEYGRTRLRRFVEHTAHHGGFNEYNSPTYTVIALHECERILHLVHDEAARADAETIRRHAWETVAEHFHPPTAQWAGPHSRTYGDRLDAGTAEYLAAQTGAPIPLHPLAAGRSRSGPTHIPPLPCPPDLAERFRAMPRPVAEIRRHFLRHEEERLSLSGTTWMDDVACLGSVSWDSLWTQRRPLVAYWRTEADPAVVLRLRFLRDGQDFATAGVRAVQRGPRVLARVGLLANKGDFHLHLDRPADGLFRYEELALRCELLGAGVTARALAGGLFELAAGERRAVIHAPPATFGERPVRWGLQEIAGGVALEGVCARGAGALDPEATDARLVLGIELLGREEPHARMPIVTEAAGELHAAWGDELRISAPLRAERLPW